jgi:beta-lactamase superfamily II metal-dependent hydrolase
MLTITFKNVGQGDSIILEWLDNGQSKIGIIDCHLLNNTNPVLNHIQQVNYQEIDFIILSHPHYDHFSGFNQLFKYCRTNKIIIQKFLHTSYLAPDYLRAANKTLNVQRELDKLFREVKQLWKFDQIILKQGFINDLTKDIRLNDGISVKILAPSTHELDAYISNVNVDNDEESHDNNANANWLSTFLKIYSTDWQIILTSDCEKRVLNRWKNNDIEFSNHRLLLAQSPHHGAKGNHNSTFWKQFVSTTQTPIVISVGENGYKHPSQDNINYFIKNGFNIYTTQQGEIMSKEAQKVSSILNIFSEKKETINARDITFQIDKQGEINHQSN